MSAKFFSSPSSKQQKCKKKYIWCPAFSSLFFCVIRFCREKTLYDLNGCEIFKLARFKSGWNFIRVTFFHFGRFLKRIKNAWNFLQQQQNGLSRPARASNTCSFSGVQAQAYSKGTDQQQIVYLHYVSCIILSQQYQNLLKTFGNPENSTQGS